MYTVWFYKHDVNFEKLIKAYEVFTGTRSECRKFKDRILDFPEQYKIHRAR